MSTSSPTGKPGRYQRSAGGLVVSLVVTVVAIAALLWFLGLFRADTKIEPEPVDYLDSVASAQGARLRPVYPASLPKDWIATGVDVTPGDDPAFAIKLLTDDERFVGIRQEGSSVGALVAKYVDEDARPADGYRSKSSVARSWVGFTDEGGDTAYAADVGDQVVLVYGSASAADLQEVIEVLTRKPVERAQ